MSNLTTIKKRGRPIGTKTGKYTVNPNQKRCGGRKTLNKTDDELLKEYKIQMEKQRKRTRETYKRKRALVLQEREKELLQQKKEDEIIQLIKERVDFNKPIDDILTELNLT